MKLKALTIQNIRSYKDQTVNFPGGTTLFEGDIGSGKSTILMAIEFALFGLGSQKGAALLKLGENEGSVKLEFAANGTYYEVTRTLVRKRSSVNQGEGYIKTPEGIIHLSPAEIKEKVLEILNFKEPASANAQSVIYRYAVFTPQEEMKYILTQKPNERVQTLRKAFGIEDYKIASDNALEIARHIKEGIIKLQERAGDIDKKKDELKENEKVAENLRGELDGLVTKQKKLVELQKADKRQLEEFRKVEKQYNEAVAQIPLIGGQLKEKEKAADKLDRQRSELEQEIKEELEPAIEKLMKVKKPTDKEEKALQNMIKSLKKLESKKDVLVGKQSTLLKSITDLERRLKQYKDKSSKEIKGEIANLSNLQKQVESDSESAKKQLNKIMEEKNKLEFQQTELKQKIDDLKGVGGVCPICERELTASHKQHLNEERGKKLKEILKALPEITKKENELDAKIKSLKKRYDESTDKISVLRRLGDAVKDLESKRKELGGIGKELKHIEAGLKIEEEKEFPKLSEYEKPSEYIQDLLGELKEHKNAQNKIGELNRAIDKNKKQMEKIMTEISTTTDEAKKIEEKLNQVRAIAEKLRDIPSQIKSLSEIIDGREEIGSLGGEIGSHEARLEELKKAREILEGEIKRKEKEKTLLIKFQDYHIWITEFLIPTLSTIEKQVMIVVRQDFESNFHKWYSMLLEEPDKDARIDEDFTPIVEQDGFEQDVSFLSGGERTSIALAYRLALNMTVQKVSTGMKSNLLILDEPTDGFSKTQLFKVREILRELNCPQVILVSHERELESFANQIFEVRKVNGVSSIISR